MQGSPLPQVANSRVGKNACRGKSLSIHARRAVGRRWIFVDSDGTVTTVLTQMLCEVDKSYGSFVYGESERDALEIGSSAYRVGLALGRLDTDDRNRVLCDRRGEFPL